MSTTVNESRVFGFRGGNDHNSSDRFVLVQSALSRIGVICVTGVDKDKTEFHLGLVAAACRRRRNLDAFYTDTSTFQPARPPPKPPAALYREWTIRDSSRPSSSNRTPSVFHSRSGSEAPESDAGSLARSVRRARTPTLGRGRSVQFSEEINHGRPSTSLGKLESTPFDLPNGRNMRLQSIAKRL